MAGEVKTLTFSEGTVVSAPLQSFLTASSLQLYADDAAYETAKGGVGTEGNIYGNTTDNVIRYHDGTVWTTVNNIKNNFTAIVPPTVNDDSGDNYSIGSFWMDTVTDKAYLLLDATVGAAIWLEMGNAFLGLHEYPAGLINGINVDFTITSVPIDDTITVYRDGIKIPADKYSYAHPIITLDDAPQVGQKIEVFYLTEGSSATKQTNAGNEIVENRVVTVGEITAKQLTLTTTPSIPSRVKAWVRGGSIQVYGIDFIVTSDVMDWNGYNLDGQIIAGDILMINYYSV